MMTGMTWIALLLLLPLHQSNQPSVSAPALTTNNDSVSVNASVCDNADITLHSLAHQ